MEEFEPHIRTGDIVYAGIDYEKILGRAAAEADVILWDSGNNDFPFFVPDLEIVLLDPHRAGDELSYFPGEVNLLRADRFIVNKLDTAAADKIEIVRENIRVFNSGAVVVDCAMPVSVEEPARIFGKKVLVVEDGPTVTHGGMSFGAGVLAARKFGAAEIIDPHPFAAGSIHRTFRQYPRLHALLPTMGYGQEQIRELEETIGNARCELRGPKQDYQNPPAGLPGVLRARRDRPADAPGGAGALTGRTQERQPNSAWPAAEAERRPSRCQPNPHS